MRSTQTRSSASHEGVKAEKDNEERSAREAKQKRGGRDAKARTGVTRNIFLVPGEIIALLRLSGQTRRQAFATVIDTLKDPVAPLNHPWTGFNMVGQGNTSATSTVVMPFQLFGYSSKQACSGHCISD